MLKRKIQVEINELNKVLLKELIGLNNMKIQNGTLYYNEYKENFNNISVKVYSSEPNRLEKLFFKKGEEIIGELEDSLKNDMVEFIEIESDLIDDDLEIRTIDFKNIKLVIMYGRSLEV